MRENKGILLQLDHHDVETYCSYYPSNIQACSLLHRLSHKFFQGKTILSVYVTVLLLIAFRFGDVHSTRTKTHHIAVVVTMGAVVGRILELWEASQVSHHGAYSLERLCAFSEYTQRHSGLRVFAVCVMTIIPPILLVLLVDSIPLQDPRLGWKANWTMWIQIFIRCFCMGLGIALELHMTAPAASFTNKSCALIALSTAIMYIIITLPITIFVAFPIPFMFFATGGIFHVSFLASVAIVVGPSKLKQNGDVKAQIKRFSNIMMLQLPMILIYPALNALYVRLDSTSRIPLILVLPVVKFVLKNFVARMATDLDDYVPTLILSTDFFSTIYQSKCLQGSGSHLTTAGVLLIDMIQNFISLRRLHNLVNDVQDLQSKANRLQSNSATSSGLLKGVLKACEHPELLRESFLAAIQLRSCATMQFPHRKKSLLATFQARQVHVQTTISSSMTESNEPKSPNHIFASKKTRQIKPLVRVALLVMSKLRPKNKIGAYPMSNRSILSGSSRDISVPEKYLISQQKTLLLKKTLQLLRRTELLILVEYVECAIPVLYGIYLMILFYLPNAKFYPELKGRDASELHYSVLRIMIYALFELLTLLWVHIMLKRRFKFSALHQLAFALEQDRNVVQGSFLCWTLVIFQFTMMHNGTSQRSR